MTLKKISSRIPYSNPHVDIVVDTVEKDGHTWEQVYFAKKNTDGVVILPVDETGIYMVNQYRYAIAESIWQFPMGAIEPNQSPEDAAKEELIEEVGITASSLTLIGNYKPEPAMTSTVMHAYLATGLSLTSNHPDATEIDLSYKHFTFAEIEEMIRSGQAACGYTMSAYLLYKMHSSK